MTREDYNKSNQTNLNYHLFDKYLNKISASTISQFGSQENVALFLQILCETGNIALSSKKIIVAQVIQLHQLIHNDKALTKCVSIALGYATKTAEAVLYDRAINGYEELTYDHEGNITARKKKYCSKSLLEYLKANSVKYQIPSSMKKHKINSKSTVLNKEDNKKDKKEDDKIAQFEVESYAEEV